MGNNKSEREKWEELKEELMEQFVDQLICETCLFTDHCYGIDCIANQEEREAKKNMMLSFLKEGKEKRL